MLKFYIFVKINTEREKHCECHLAAVDKVIALLVTQWCLTLHDPMDYSLLGSSAHEILQARILKSIAIPFSRGSSRPRDGTHISSIYLYWQAGSLPLAPPEKPIRS